MYFWSVSFTEQLFLFFERQFFQLILVTPQCSKWYEISNMDIFQITEENPDPPTNQGAYFIINLTKL